MELVLVRLIVGEVVQQHTLQSHCDYEVLIPLTVGEVIQRGMFWHLMTISFCLYIRKNPPSL